MYVYIYIYIYIYISCAIALLQAVPTVQFRIDSCYQTWSVQAGSNLGLANQRRGESNSGMENECFVYILTNPHQYSPAEWWRVNATPCMKYGGKF
jgi:hypothetical protein